MKTVIGLMSIVFVFSFASLPVKSAKMTCPSRTFACYLCGICLPNGEICTCKNACPATCQGHLLAKEPKTVYVIPEGAIFNCETGKSPTKAFPDQGNDENPAYWTCP